MIFVNEISKSLKTIGGILAKNSPAILTGLGCAGVLTTAIFTGRATLKASKLIEFEEQCRKEEAQLVSNVYPEPEIHLLTPIEVIKLTWTSFIPPILMGITSIICIVGANSINTSRSAALAALYSLSETAFREYKEKVVEQIGRNKEVRIRDDIAKDRITNNPVGDRTIIITGNGDVLCYDALSDRYFRSSAEKIRQIVLNFSYSLRSANWLDLNELYYSLGLPSTKLGDQMGFDLDRTRDGNIEIDYSSNLTPNGEPCLSIEATVYPKYMR